MLELPENRYPSGVVGDIDAALAAARAGDQHQFSALTEPYRRELQVHCYRILGSLQDAEDLVQETLLRAWRRLDTYEGRASIRAWLYKIATNACLDALDKRSRRVLPSMLSPATDASQPFTPPVDEPIWLEPLPDHLIVETASDPEARYSLHESVTLAFVAALQSLPPRQRAVLILRDVLDWRASEVADLLDLTVSAVNSALHRARVTLSRHYHGSAAENVTGSPADDHVRALLDRYVSAWESADVAGLTALLKEDAVLNMPPSPSWYHGRDAIRAFLQSTIFGSVAFPGSGAGRWRLTPTRANGQPGFGVYLRGPSGAYAAFGIIVVAIDGDRVASITHFGAPTLLARFGLPDELAA